MQASKEPLGKPKDNKRAKNKHTRGNFEFQHTATVNSKHNLTPSQKEQLERGEWDEAKTFKS